MDERRLEPIIESYNVDEEYIYKDIYMFIKGVATAKEYNSTLKALPLARRIHNGQYRKGDAKFKGEWVKLPYILHCLKVCSTLISLHLQLCDEEKDILYAAALLHDAIEERRDLFPRGGIEFHDEYDFPMRLVEVVKLLSKQPGLDEYEINRYFNELKRDKLALMIKLADRSHNVEDLYNMKNITKYIEETRTYFLENGICAYGKDHYPELSDGITMIKSKILSLTEVQEMGELSLKKKDEEIARLKEENAQLRKQIEELKGKS